MLQITVIQQFCSSRHHEARYHFVCLFVCCSSSLFYPQLSHHRYAFCVYVGGGEGGGCSLANVAKLEAWYSDNNNEEIGNTLFWGWLIVVNRMMMNILLYCL